MSNITPVYDDEIDLLSLIQTLWDGKWKIAFVTACSVLSVIGFNIVKPNTTFIAKTEIKPITSLEVDKYSLFNSSLKLIEQEKIEQKVIKENDENIEKNETSIFEITQKSLLKLYIEEVEEGTLLEAAIDKFDLINKNNFDSNTDYKEAVEKFASEIKVLKPTKKNTTISHHVIEAEYNNKDKWKELLTFVNNEANRKVKSSITDRFATKLSIQNLKKKFAVKDLEIKIENVKKDYDRIAKDRIAFLTEQAAIARKLGIQKNTISSQRFSTQNTFVTNVKIDAPFYVRGFIAIEEEINQIKNRKNKNSFIKNLYVLEQKKRDLEQDQSLVRAKDLFYKTPLNQNNFQATIVKVATTDFEIYDYKNLYYALAIIFGFIIGVVYVLINNALQNRKSYKLNS